MAPTSLARSLSGSAGVRRRNLNLVDTLIQDVRFALRMLLRMRGLAVVATLTLALGIAATTTMFSIW